MLKKKRTGGKGADVDCKRQLRGHWPGSLAPAAVEVVEQQWAEEEVEDK